MTKPRALLLDEPTRGIDVGAKSEIFSLMADEASRGLAVLFATSEIHEALTMSNRIIVLSKGSIVGQFDPRTATKDEVMIASGRGRGRRQRQRHPSGVRRQGGPGMNTTLERPAPPATAVGGSTSRLPSRFDVLQLLLRGSAFIALIFLIIVFALQTDTYLSSSNLITMTKHVAINAILALGMLLVILKGGIDLSVGSIVGLSGVVAAQLLKGVEVGMFDVILFPPVWVIVIVSLLVGTFVGLVNGLLVTRFSVAPVHRHTRHPVHGAWRRPVDHGRRDRVDPAW